MLLESLLGVALEIPIGDTIRGFIKILFEAPLAIRLEILSDVH